MGMFDYIECEMELPIPFEADPDDFLDGGAFQTKCFECLMDTYRITRDGHLVLRVYDFEDTGRWYTYSETFKRIEYDEKPEGFEVYPIQKETNVRWVPFWFTGQFNFYASTREGWREYVATVQDGVVTDIRADYERMWRTDNVEAIMKIRKERRSNEHQ